MQLVIILTEIVKFKNSSIHCGTIFQEPKVDDAADFPNLQLPKAIMVTEDVSVDYIAFDLHEF
jgi:hypothetical protein